MIKVKIHHHYHQHHPSLLQLSPSQQQGLTFTKHHFWADTGLRALRTSSYLILTTPLGRTEARGGLVTFLGHEVRGLIPDGL